eukprot:Pgem_evm1s13334
MALWWIMGCRGCVSDNNKNQYANLRAAAYLNSPFSFAGDNVSVSSLSSNEYDADSIIGLSTSATATSTTSLTTSSKTTYS